MIDFVRTPQGYYQQSPTPSQEELAAYYRDKYYQLESGQYTASYTADEIRWFDLGAAISDYVWRDRRGRPAGHLLDVGCGEGFLMSGMAARGWSVLGYDYSSFAITHCNPELVDRFEQGDVYQLLERDIISGTLYDLLNLTNVLEHVPEPVELLRRLRHLCAQDGMITINVPNDFSELQMTLFETGRVDRQYWLAPTEHLNYFSLDSLSRTLDVAGWRIVCTLSDFPIEHFLLHDGSNYVADREKGRQAHLARVLLDLHFARNLPAYVSLLEAQAACGVGRSLIAFAEPA
jgi:2-polyprenyl-3-methyl-5-hydroxy-6-metoxy-1,4-benzoquinol methylase